MRLGIVTLIGLLLATPAAAQTRPDERPGAVQVIVRDITELPIAGAQVRLMAPDGSTIRAETDGRGEATFDDLRPGTYSGQVEAPGFATLTVNSLAVGAGRRMTREVTLQVAAYIERLNVTPPADDRLLMNAFSEQLSDDQLAALPEDPDELARVLRQLVGDNAEIRVNGFRGVPLPLGTQIRDIRIRYDVGAASSGNGPRIDIRASPGGGWRNKVGANVQDEAWSSRNALSSERPVGQTQQYFWTLNAPLVRDRTGLSLSVERSQSTQSQVIRAAVPGGFYSSLLGQPAGKLLFYAGLEHEINAGQSLRVDVTRSANKARNLGIGELDLPERAYESDGSETELQVAHHATFGSSFVNDIKFTLGVNSTSDFSGSDARTIYVLDAFTSGGAQQQGGSRSRNFQIENTLEFALGRRHQLSAGVTVDRVDYHSDASSNAFGTYTFTSLAAFEAGQPATFTQRIGDPTYDYSMNFFGWQVRDDYRVGRHLLLNLGLRHDFQTHVQDWVNFSPRVGLNWTPSSRARTTLRASAEVVHSPLPAAIYGRTLLLNGLRQSDLVITDPGYPDPFSAGATRTSPPPSIVRARADLQMPEYRGYSVGVDQPIGQFLRFRGTLSQQVGRRLFRSRDANAPVDGVRPDPSVLSVTELESTARAWNRSIRGELAINVPRQRLSGSIGYTRGRARDETEWAFSLPPNSLDLSGEWGPARNDIRNRANASVYSDLPGGLRVHASFYAQSAAPYTITTGVDSNGDGIFSERPAGVTRNSARGADMKNLDLTVTWRVGRQRRSSDTDASVAGARRSNDAFRLEIFARATNVLNFVNPQNFSGVLTSPFFGQPTSVGAPRRVEIGTSAWF